MATKNGKAEGVACLLLNSNTGRLLLHQRDNKTELYPLYWTSLGGTVEKNELPKEAALRELQEEIEITTHLYHWTTYTHLVKVSLKEVEVLQHVFVGTIDYQIDKIKLNEGLSVKYFDRSEIVSKLSIAFNFKNLFLRFFDEIVINNNSGYTLKYSKLS
jgi:8-oxo-dGTP pyrophosphatase MutT (NUDIX family)